MPDDADDRQVLVAFYNATDGSGWDADAKVNWLSTNPIGQWAGVTTLTLPFQRERNIETVSQSCGTIGL